jgi:tRNA 2-thiouridine synthesizing protein A
MIIIDLTAHRCPYPLVQTKMLLKQLAAGDKLQILLSDPGSRQDVPQFLKKIGRNVEVSSDTPEALSLIIG